jgi:hypothetical protein
MRLVILESPFAGDVETNTAYARACVRDCLEQDESPIASHLLFTQPGILRDGLPGERALGIAAGLEWYKVASAAVFYLDRGMSRGMAEALEHLEMHHPLTSVEYRFTALRQAFGAKGSVHFPWCEVPGRAVVDMPRGRLECAHNRHAPNPVAPYQVRHAGASIAFYPTMARALAGAEHYYRWGLTTR